MPERWVVASCADVERRHTGLGGVDGDEGEDADEHERRGREGVDEELRRRVAGGRSAPTGDEEVGRARASASKKRKKTSTSSREEAPEAAGLEEEHPRHEGLRLRSRAPAAARASGKSTAVMRTRKSEMPSTPSDQAIPSDETHWCSARSGRTARRGTARVAARRDTERRRGCRAAPTRRTRRLWAAVPGGRRGPPRPGRRTRTVRKGKPGPHHTVHPRRRRRARA